MSGRAEDIEPVFDQGLSIEEFSRTSDPVSVLFEIDITEPRKFNFIMRDTTNPPSPKGPVISTENPGVGYFMVVPNGVDRSFTFKLSDSWDWTFDPPSGPGNKPYSHKKGPAGLYAVEYVDPKTIIIHARSRGGNARVSDGFNMYVKFEQTNADPISVRIDPVTDNPPSGRMIPESKREFVSVNMKANDI